MRINLDHQAFCPLLPEAREAMLPFLDSQGGNPLSTHSMGKAPREAVEAAREKVARLIRASGDEIIFTSCASEANNLAVKGVAASLRSKGKHIIASPIEHHSVLHPLKRLMREGFSVSWLSVDAFGMVDPDELRAMIRPDTILITVSCASNEIGTLEPIRELGRVAREHGVPFHTDATACAGSVPLDVNDLNVDLLSLASNPIYGPQGVGALYVRSGTRILPLIEGGIQEWGLRAGTHNVAGIVGMGTAAEIARAELNKRRGHMIALRDLIIEGVLRGIHDVSLTGHPVERLPGHASFTITGIEGESLVLHLDLRGISASTGSTCASQAQKTSHVLSAMGMDPVAAQGSVVLTLGMDNTIHDVETFLKELPPIVKRLREMSPLAASRKAS
jgi:cysteine desulfurase